MHINDTAPLNPAFLTGTPHAASDLADFRDWLRRPDRPSLRGPVVVMPAVSSCKAFARAARLGLLLAHASRVRHVVLPVVDPAWHINTTALHAAFPNLLPTTVARLLLPRLTFDALFSGGVNATIASDASLDATFAPELTLIDRTRRAAASRTTLWTANATDTLHAALRAGLSEWDWLMVHNAANVDSAVEHTLRAAVTKGSDEIRIYRHALLLRIDNAFKSVCNEA